MFFFLKLSTLGGVPVLRFGGTAVNCLTRDVPVPFQQYFDEFSHAFQR